MYDTTPDTDTHRSLMTMSVPGTERGGAAELGFAAVILSLIKRPIAGLMTRDLWCSDQHSRTIQPDSLEGWEIAVKREASTIDWSNSWQQTIVCCVIGQNAQPMNKTRMHRYATPC